MRTLAIAVVAVVTRDLDLVRTALYDHLEWRHEDG
jgi:hypothetical protein